MSTLHRCFTVCSALAACTAENNVRTRRARIPQIRDVNKATEYKAKAKARTFKAKATSISPRPDQGQGQKQIPKANAKANVLLLLLHSAY